MRNYSLNTIVAVFVLLVLPLSAQAQSSVSNAGFAFPASTPELYFQFEAESEGEFTAALYVVNVGGVVPAGYEVASITLTGRASDVLNFSYGAPEGGWPVGIYRIVVNRGAEPVHESDFHVFEQVVIKLPAATPTAPATNTSQTQTQ